MKVQRKEIDPSFTPFDLVITIESKDECILLEALSARDATVPQLLTDMSYLNNKQSSSLSGVMLIIYKKLINIS